MIPCYINTFNRLTTTRELCKQVASLDGVNPVIIDNASNYEPLLDWYESCDFEVIHLRENLGHHAPWKSGIIKQDNAKLYIVTDCDLDLTGVPRDVVEILKEPFNWVQPNRIIKSGLALRIDDLPDWQTDVINWEKKWWANQVGHDPRFYYACIDTTFAMYEQKTPNDIATRVVNCPAVRLAGEYQARHTPWYLDCNNMSEEDIFYFNNANSSNSWKVNGKKLSTKHK
jgi:hypothetical protein